jgi:hypothetical protein
LPPHTSLWVYLSPIYAGLLSYYALNPNSVAKVNMASPHHPHDTAKTDPVQVGRTQCEKPSRGKRAIDPVPGPLHPLPTESAIQGEAHQVHLPVSVKEGDEQRQEKRKEKGVLDADWVIEPGSQEGVAQDQGEVDHGHHGELP